MTATLETRLDGAMLTRLMVDGPTRSGRGMKRVNDTWLAHVIVYGTRHSVQYTLAEALAMIAKAREEATA